MFDWWRLEEAARYRLEPLTEAERRRLQLLAEMRNERSPRRWIASALVRLGLRLDPDALPAAPVRVRA